MIEERTRAEDQTLYYVSCWLYAQLLLLYPHDLYFRYADEMRLVFSDQLRDAGEQGAPGYLSVWWGVLRETVVHLGPATAVRLGIVGVALLCAVLLMVVPALLVRPVRFPVFDHVPEPRVQAVSERLHARERMVTVEPGVQVQVMDWGGIGRPLVLLTGLGSDAHVFDSFAAQLVPHYHVYGITRRGFGASSKPAPTPDNYAADRLADDVLAVVDQLHLERPVLAGHSIAGEELSSIGSRHPEKVAGLIYLDAGDGYGFYDRAHGDWQLDMNNVRHRIDAVASGTPMTRQTLKALQESAGRLERSTGDVMQQVALMPRETTSGAPPPLPAVALAIRFGEQKYTEIHGPVLAIFACPHDFRPMYGTDAEARRRMEALDGQRCSTQAMAFQLGVPQARVVRLRNADHFVFLSNSREVMAAMDAFMQRLQ